MNMDINYNINFSYDYIDREKRTMRDVVFSKRLSCIPHEEYAAKYFHEYVINHPEEDVKNLHCEIEKVEREEDHYGNGGGYDYTFIIFKEREENPSEYAERVSHAEFKLIDSYMKALKTLTKKLNDGFDCKDKVKNELLSELLLNNFKNIVSEEILGM